MRLIVSRVWQGSFKDARDAQVEGKRYRRKKSRFIENSTGQAKRSKAIA